MQWAISELMKIYLVKIIYKCAYVLFPKTYYICHLHHIFTLRIDYSFKFIEYDTIIIDVHFVLVNKHYEWKVCKREIKYDCKSWTADVYFILMHTENIVQ